MTQFTSHLHLTLPSVMTLIMTTLLGLMLLPLLGVVATRDPEPHAHAPCYDCEFYNIMQHDQGFHDRQINSQCQYPCKCSNRDHKCKAGVNLIKDGCDCCYMCARQQGDLCDYKDKCDEEKGLYCDFQFDDGARGICRAKEAKSCTVDGETYKDGEEFKMGCKMLCTCQNGQHACSTLCPQEDRRPSRLHCREPRLIEIQGQCCKEWTCPIHYQQGPYPNEDSGSLGPGSVSKDCKKETTPWSACSVSCGMGVSMRVTNDNEDCQPVQQRRLCLVRPCELNDKHLKGRHCKNTWKAERDQKIKYDGCESLKAFKPKYCATCKRHRCCSPDQTKTISLEFECGHNHDRITVHDFMWIKSCICRDHCP